VKRRLEPLVADAELCAVALDPELEAALGPTWHRVKAVLASRRDRPPPDDAAVLERARALQRREQKPKAIPGDRAEATSTVPKELLAGLMAELNLRAAPHVFAELGEALSIPALKEGDALARIASALVRWFPPAPGGASAA